MDRDFNMNHQKDTNQLALQGEQPCTEDDKFKIGIWRNLTLVDFLSQ